MTLIDLAGIALLERGDGLPDEIEEQIYSDGKIRAVEKSDTMLLNQLADAGQFLGPPGGSDHHVLSRGDAGADVFNDAAGGGEIYHRVDRREAILGQRCGVPVFCRAQDFDFVSTFARNVGDPRTRFAGAEQEEFHLRTSLACPRTCCLPSVTALQASSRFLWVCDPSE